MRRPRLADAFVILGVLGLAAAIGEGRYESVQARERTGPLLWQLEVYDDHGRLLRDHQVLGQENKPVGWDAQGPAHLQLKMVLLPLGLPEGDLDVHLRLSVNGSPMAPLDGIKMTPGQTVQLDVPGRPLKIALRAVRMPSRRPLFS